MHQVAWYFSHLQELREDSSNHRRDFFLDHNHLVTDLQDLLMIVAKSWSVKIAEHRLQNFFSLHIDVILEVWFAQVFEALTNQLQQGTRKLWSRSLLSPVKMHDWLRVHATKDASLDTIDCLRSRPDHLFKPVHSFLQDESYRQVPRRQREVNLCLLCFRWCLSLIDQSFVLEPLFDWVSQDVW